jgi:hypothetical protein
VVVDRAPEGEDPASDFELQPDVEALVDDEAVSDDAPDDERHYLQDPDQLADNARDPDEREQDDELVLDQTELDELGSTLDDPHQPEPE